MTSPSGCKTRRKRAGHTSIGKASPSPEMPISSLTRGQVFGKDQDANLDLFPAPPDMSPRLSVRVLCFYGIELVAFSPLDARRIEAERPHRQLGIEER